MQHARTHRLHLMGLCSDGGVHSLLTHLYALLEMAKQQGVEQVFRALLHGWPRHAARKRRGFHRASAKGDARRSASGKIATVSGRYYAMDRDKRWDRIERAFGAMVLGNGEKSTDPVAAREAVLRTRRHRRIHRAGHHRRRAQQPVGLIRDDDACIFFNYRADRGREMTMALTDPTLEKPSRSLAPKNLHFTTMTEYDKNFTVPFVLPREHPNNILADVMAQLNWKNLRVAETEKYAHVTYFFNGGNEKPYPGESRELVPSPKVATYDLKPEMSAQGITDVVVKAIDQRAFDVIVMNFANADMVGHSGKMAPTVRAVEAVDAASAKSTRR